MSIFSLLIQSLPNKINVQSCKNVNKKKKTYKKDKLFIIRTKEAIHNLGIILKRKNITNKQILCNVFKGQEAINGNQGMF
jgi:hypothetical protein